MNDSNEAHRIFYSDAEWDLLAEATLRELVADETTWCTGLFHVVNAAQKNQLKFLLGADYGKPNVQWPERKFTGYVQLSKLVPRLHSLINRRLAAAAILPAKLDEKVAELAALNAKLRDTLLREQRLTGELIGVRASVDARTQQLDAAIQDAQNRKTPLSSYSDDAIIGEYHKRMHEQDARYLRFSNEGQVLMQETATTLAEATRMLESQKAEMGTVSEKVFLTLNEVRETLAKVTAMPHKPTPPPAEAHTFQRSSIKRH